MRPPPPRAQLPALGINPDSISFRNTTIDSDKAICIREDVGEARNIVIVDLPSRAIRHKKPMAAEAAIMNPVRLVSARAPGCVCALVAACRSVSGSPCGLLPPPASTHRARVCAQDGNTIAVRAGQAMQIFNLELSKKIKSHKMDDSKPVQFWCWISLNTVAIVTDTEVFHWSVDGTWGAPAARVHLRACLRACRSCVRACVRACVAG